MRLKSIRRGQKNPKTLVKAWQTFLLGRGLYSKRVDGDFGDGTHDATVAFQISTCPLNFPLKGDGWVGTKTYGKAQLLGFDPVIHEGVDRSGPNWPPRPSDLKPLVGTTNRQRVFGKFRYKSAPIESNPEAILVLDGWYGKNIVQVDLPLLKDLPGTWKGSTRASFHRSVAPSVQELFQRWDDAGLGDLVKTWGGSYNPRFIRGSRRTLSNHSFGTAFDINVPWNMLGHRPALVGDKGSVRELVPIANELGWYWGGHFSGRKDGMHFEATEKAIRE